MTAQPWGRDLERILPAELLELPQWVAWKLEPNAKGDMTKVPYNPRTGYGASSTNPQTWADFRMACRRAATPGYAGVGFVVSRDDPYTGVDLDKCRDPHTGDIEPWAQEIIRALDSYSEVSPSGRGIRIFVRAVLPEGKRRKGRAEMYESARFFTVTGAHIEGTPFAIEARQPQIMELHRSLFPEDPKPGPRKSAAPSEPTRLDDAAIVKKALAAKNGTKFAALWNGDTSEYGGDESRADLALVSLLAFYTQDEAQVDRLFRQSGLMRAKWERADYRERTIRSVLATVGETYKPSKVPPLLRPDQHGPAQVTQGQPETDGANALQEEPPGDTDAQLLRGEADDNGNAEAMYRLFGREYLYTPAIGWLRWTGTHWQEVPEPVVQQKAITALKRRRIAAVKADKEYIVKATKQDRARVTGCLTLFKSYVIEPDVATFDSDPDLLNCRNGVLNLRTGALTPHSPKQRFTYCLAIPWNPQADSGAWEAWILDALGGNVASADYLQLCVGYSLTGHTREEKLFYLYGPTRAGKGTTTETLLHLLPRPLSNEVDFATFTAKRDSDSQNFDLAALKPARFIVASESNRSQSLNSAKIKQLTGGNYVRCAFKHKDMFEYRPQFKVWLVSNWEVKADPDDTAIWGRVQVFNFPNSHLGQEDVMLKARMRSPEALQGVLRWAVEGAMRWYATDHMEPPESVVKATAEHRDSQDYIKQWITDYCEMSEGAWAQSSALMKSYTAWCEANNIRAIDPRSFADALRRFGCVQKRQAGTGLRGFTGIMPKIFDA